MNMKIEVEATAEKRVISVSGSFPALTRKQANVLALLLQGMTNKEVGREMECSHRTVEDHRRTIYEKLGVHSMTAILYQLTGQPLIIP